MIGLVRGTVISYTQDIVIVENNGVAFEIYYPHTNELHLHEDVTIHTHMRVSENDISLYGFPSLEEKELFLRLTKVKGIGPKIGMNILASHTYNEIVMAIESSDVALLKKMPGIGEKSASQIVLDLKGKLITVNNVSPGKKDDNLSPEARDTLEALKNLGYKQGDLNSILYIFNENPDLSTEEYLRLALRSLRK